MNSNRTNHKRSLIIGGALTVLTLICIVMTCIFVYVSSQANERVDAIRADYSAKASGRDERISSLDNKIIEIQKKLDSLPDRTANKTADKVKQVVKEDEK